MDDGKQRGIGSALGRIPSGVFIVTARHEDRRTGMMASWVQQLCFEPPMVSLAVAKGRPIMPLISESRRFGVCQLPEGEKVITRKFEAGIVPGDDPFLGFEMLNDCECGVPILANVLAYVVCDLTCHMDVEGDHDLFIGTVTAGDYIAGEPQIRLRDSGFTY